MLLGHESRTRQPGGTTCESVGIMSANGRSPDTFFPEPETLNSHPAKRRGKVLGPAFAVEVALVS